MSTREPIDLELICGQYRALKEKLEQLNAAHEEKIAPIKAWLKQKDEELLTYLSQTNQKSAKTAKGTAYWSATVTYKVEDVEAFRQHILTTQQYGLMKWAANPKTCEEYTEHNKATPPGLARSSVRTVHVIAPERARKRPTAATAAPPAQAMQPEVETME